MIFLFYLLEVDFIADIRYQSRAILFLYLMGLFVVLIKMHSCTHPYVQHFYRKLMGYFPFINSVAKRDVTVDGDVSEYPKTYETSFKHADGRKARVFSSADQSTVDLHFKWMKDYGVDGVFMQRFVGYTRGNQENSVPNRILANALEAASKYDLSLIHISEPTRH